MNSNRSKQMQLEEGCLLTLLSLYMLH